MPGFIKGDFNPVMENVKHTVTGLSLVPHGEYLLGKSGRNAEAEEKQGKRDMYR
jgi:hypothetical protein